MKEAPRRSMQMHEDVVHCGPDGLLPGGALYREPGLQLLPGKKPTLPCLTGRIRRCTDVLTEIPLRLWSNSIELIRLLCPPRGPLCIFRHSQ